MIAKPCLLRLLASLFVSLCVPVVNVPAQSLVSYDMATPAGLERAWFGQAQVDVSRHRMRGWKLHKDMLFGVTSSGLIHAFNAETGETLWTAQPGPLDQPAFGPAVNDEYVAIVSGGELYVLDRASGKFLWSRPLGSAPAGAPALSDEVAFVTFLDGRVEGYHLQSPEKFPWYSQSVGRIFHSPTASGSVVTWPTNRGYLYVGQANGLPRVLYRIETDAPATAPPTEADPFLYVTAADGHVYCFDAQGGNEAWRYSMGYQATCRPAVVGDRVYVASSEPMLHVIDAKTGKLLWTAPDVTEFAAQGLKNVYGLDEFGRLLILDKETGRFVGTLPGTGYDAVFNEDSDRLYLVNDRGLVQCLHEVGAHEPTLFSVKPAKEEEAAPAQAADPAVEQTQPETTSPYGEEPATEEPATEESPFDNEEDNADDEESPFSFGE
jgi:outer membrane protein assembly factor BamB